MMQRADIYGQLRSFDHAAVDEDGFERGTLGLLSGDFSTAADVHAHFLARPRRIEPRTMTDEAWRQADDCLDNVFDFYGERHSVGNDIDWDHNPGTDHWVHDLNRFAYLGVLIRATLAGGDDKYARKAADLVADWVAKNDASRSPYWSGEAPMRGALNGAWRSYLNIAIHLRRWTEVFEELVRFWTPRRLLDVLKSIHDQLAYLEIIIPTAHNNWIIIGADGMVSTAVALPELRDAQRFIDYAWQKALPELDRQVLPDGMQFELSQGYHGVVECLVGHMMSACRGAGLDVPEIAEQVTAAMLDYTMQTITPDGLQIAFNDSDPESGSDARSRLADEGRRRGRPDWLYVGTAGSEGQRPSKLSQAFEYGGYYVMRTGWGPDDTFLAFDGGPWGYSHQHDDRLGFWLSALGRSFLIDPGRYLYDENNPFSRRKYLNTTRAHSTITVDGHSQADRYFRESWEPTGKLTDNTWIVGDDFQRVAGSHTLGYGQDGCIKVVHRRSITFWPPGVFLVLDRLTGDGPHEVHSRLQFYPGDVQRAGDVFHTVYPNANLAVLPLMDCPFETSVVKGRLDPTAGWYSAAVNRIEPSPTLTVAAKAALPLRGGFLIVPYKGAVPPQLAVAFNGDRVDLTVESTQRVVSFSETMR